MACGDTRRVALEVLIVLVVILAVVALIVWRVFFARNPLVAPSAGAP
jgi:cytoskeletal protein RodZ